MRSDRKGNAFVTVTSMLTMLGFGALTVDVGLIRVAHTELQAAIDAATLSAASQLEGTEASIGKAVATALDVAARNPALGHAGITLKASEVYVGWKDPDTGEFVPWAHGMSPDGVDTVVIEHPPEHLAAALGLPAFGRSEYTLESESTALRPFRGLATKRVRCYLPLAVPNCWLDGLQPGTNPKPLKFTFSPTPTDRVSWGDPNKNPDTTTVRTQLRAQCASRAIEVGELLYVNEGNHTPALNEVEDIVTGVGVISADTWSVPMYGPLPARDGTADGGNEPSRSSVPASRWGRTLEGVIPLVDAGNVCSAQGGGASFTGTLRITGFAWAVIYDVRNKGSDKNIYVQIDVKNVHKVWGHPDPDLKSNIQTRSAPALVESP